MQTNTKEDGQYREITKALRKDRVVVPRKFVSQHRAEFSRGRFDEIITDLQCQKLDLVDKLLHHPEFDKLIAEGYITFAAIKPHTEISKLGVKDDVKGAVKILTSIPKPIEPIFVISLMLSEQDVQAFYGEVKSRIPLDRWSALEEYMVSGPVTYLALYDPRGNAVENWRSLTGVTDPKLASKNSIRGRFAEDMAHNLVHGSSSIDDAKREFEFLRYKVKEMLNGNAVSI